MCLEVFAVIATDAESRISAARLSELSGLRVSTQKIEGRSALHFSATGGCSCDFLSDDADFDCEYWSMSAQHLPALAEAIGLLSRHAGKFSFVARWINEEPPAKQQKLSGGALVDLIAKNRVGNNVVYQVG